jgi:ABC-type dipeptide/oligopeptide/nickel transport system permease component
MGRFLLRRLAVIPLALVLVNFIGFTYAHVAIRFQQAQNPWGTGVENSPPILPLYGDYVRSVLRLDFGKLPVGVSTSVAEAVLTASGASLGLLMLAFMLSLIAGLLLGLRAVRLEPAGVSRWLMPLSTIGMATPSFFVGTLFVVAVVYYVLWRGPNATSPLPLQGFGWDVHLVLPALALMLRPTVQIAHVTASLLSGEINQPYVVAARSRGNSWNRIRWRHALRNVLAPVILTIAGSLRWLVGELILVEWLFAWPGLGRLLALALLPPNVAAPGALIGSTAYFLHPELIAALLTVFALVFVVIDTLASTLARVVDPRLRAPAGEARRA